MKNIYTAVFFALFPFLFICQESYSQNLKINELMSSNVGTVEDEDGDTPDWIEIFNYGNSAVNLGDYFLSDDAGELLKWQFPALTLAPNEPLLVFASDKDRKPQPLIYHFLGRLGKTCQRGND